MPLAPASQGVHPLPLDFVANPAELVTAMVQGEVLVEAAQHHREVLLLLASLPMPVPQQPLAGASEELTATLGAGNADQGKAPCPIHPTGVFEAKKLKRLWPLSVLAPRGGGKTPKEQQPSLVLGQLQIEPRKTLPQMVLEVLCISPKLEASHKIIGKTHEVRLALALQFEFLFEPQVEREVQIQITQHRRYWSALRRALLGRDDDPISHHPSLKPFSNQLKDRWVGDPMGHHLA